MSNIVSKRFLECFVELKKTGRVRSARQFAQSLDYLPQNLTEIKKGRRDVTIELIRKAVATYDFNPHYLYTGQGQKFLTNNTQNALRILTVVTDSIGNECIIHIPYPAQAGYACGILDQERVDEFPAYRLPGYEYGTHRSFEISGDSMEPTLSDGDIVICSYVDPQSWCAGNNNRQVFVFVLENEVLVKRLALNTEQQNTIGLISDNKTYKEQVVSLEEVREIWRVTAVLSKFTHQTSRKPTSVEIQEILLTINRQSHLINSLQQRLIDAGHTVH